MRKIFPYALLVVFAVIIGLEFAAVAAPAASELHDPLAAPAGTLDDLKTAKSLGWGVLVMASLIIATRALGRLGGVWSKLATGKVALAIGTLGALAAAAYDALINGGAWMTAATTAVVAAAAYWDSASKPKAAE